MNRSNSQNRLYHELCSQLKATDIIKIWDGRFETLGYQNPFIFRARPFSYDVFRDLLKALDLEYPRDLKGVPLSSAKTSSDEMTSHIHFLNALLIEEA